MKKPIWVFVFLIIALIDNTAAQRPAWTWALTAGGVSLDEAYSVTTDSKNNIIVTGRYTSPNIVFGMDTLNNQNHFFIVKYNSSGDVLWTTSGAGISNSYGIDVITDSEDNIILTGRFIGYYLVLKGDTLFSPNYTYGGVFLAKYSSSGELLWESLGAAYNDWASVHALAVDNNDNIVISGDFSGFYMIFGSDTLEAIEHKNVFFIKYEPDGNIIVTKTAGAPYSISVNDIATDNENNILFTGYFSNYIIFDSDTLFRTGGRCFIVKYDPYGSVLWKMNPEALLSGHAIKTDNISNIIVTGSFISDTVILGSDTLLNTNPCSNYSDIFIIKYDSYGNVIWGRSGGGVSTDNVTDMAIDKDNNVIITGDYSSPVIYFGTDSLINLSTLRPGTSVLMEDVFTCKYDSSGNHRWSVNLGNKGLFTQSIIASDTNNNYVIVGNYTDKILFGTDTFSSKGHYDLFLAKLGEITDSSYIGNHFTDGLIVYPNPCTEDLTIEILNSLLIDESLISLYDMQGRLLLRQAFIGSKATVYISSFTKGAYVARIINSDFNQSVVIIKQ